MAKTTSRSYARKLVLEAVDRERDRQVGKWGHQQHDDGTWLIIATEEIGEIAQAMQASKSWGKETDAKNKYKETIQAAAVLLAYAEQQILEQDQDL